MKSVVETVNPTRVRLAVEVPFAELEPSIKSAYRRIASQITIPGFRRGKVPPVIIDQRIGRPAVLDEAVNEALPRLYGELVQQNELSPVGQPQVDVTDLTDGQEFKFTVEVDVRPTVALPEWQGLRVEVPDTAVTEEDVETRLRALQSRFGTLVTVDRPAGERDFVVVDLHATSNGEPVAGGDATGVSYQIGSGELLEGIDQAVTGLSAGESATFRSALDGVEGQVECVVTVSTVKEQQLPELDDEFAQLASEFDTLDELRDDIRGQVRHINALQQATVARDRTVDALLEKAGDIPLPEGVVAAEMDEHFRDGHGDEAHRGDFEQELRRGLAAQFVLDEIVKAENIQVSQEELTAAIIARAARSGVDANQLAEQYVQSGTIPALLAEVARGKALNLVIERATVMDSSGQPVDLAAVEVDEGVGGRGGGIQFAEYDEDAEFEGEAIDDDPDYDEAASADGPAAGDTRR